MTKIFKAKKKSCFRTIHVIENAWIFTEHFQGLMRVRKPIVFLWVPVSPTLKCRGMQALLRQLINETRDCDYFQIFLIWVFLRTICICKVIELTCVVEIIWVLCGGVVSWTVNLTILSNACTFLLVLMVLIFKFGCKLHNMGITELILNLLGIKSLLCEASIYGKLSFPCWIVRPTKSQIVSCLDMHVLVNSRVLAQSRMSEHLQS